MRAKNTKHSKAKLEQRLKALQDISVELMASRDPHDLQRLIVAKAVKLLDCDAGTLYLRYDDEHLNFEVAVNRSIDVKHFQRSLIPLSRRGLATHVFNTGRALRIDDVQSLAPDLPYSFDDSFDRLMNYTTRSTLVQPLRSSRGQILGVLQLINRKKSFTQAWPGDDPEAIATMPTFTEADGRLLESFAAVASTSIENAGLHGNIQQLFEGFVKASVHAIESRDFSTRGHSDRVAILSVELARKVSDTQDSGLKDIRFSEAQVAELRYASLLHDFGKIGVKESTLQKNEKLSPEQRSEIRARFNEFRSVAEVRVLRAYLNELVSGRRVPTEFEMAELDRKVREFGGGIEKYWQLVCELSRPSVLNDDKSNRLNALTHVHCHNCDGELKPLLRADEIRSLRILKGSLSEEERIEIESHVSHSFEFLKKIPWTPELARVPEIAFAHHERMDGSGYPRRIRGAEIPVQAKLMAIVDVYDALVASDRPYKAAVPVERALQIVEDECRAGKLDAGLFRVFLEARVFECEEIRAFNQEFVKKAA